MTKTKIIRDVPERDVPLVEAGLRADGYAVHSERQSDGRFTVIGIRQIPDVSHAVSAPATRSGPGAAAVPMSKTKIVTDVPEQDVARVEAGLQADGYSTSRQRQPNGLYTVVGVKQVRSVDEAIRSTASDENPSSAAPTTRRSSRSRRR